MIYFIRQGLLGNVKIGSTSDPVKRLKQLQTGQPVRLRLMRLVKGERAEEMALHKTFSHLRLTGEWFKFDDRMQGDIGLADLPRPEVSRFSYKHDWPTTKSKYERQVHEEFLDLIGGKDEFARRLEILPWEVLEAPLGGSIRREWWSAVVLLLRERGVNSISFKTFLELRAASEKEKEESKRDNGEDARKHAIKNEMDWLKGHPGVSPWWDLHPDNAEHMKSLRLVAPTDGVIAA